MLLLRQNLAGGKVEHKTLLAPYGVQLRSLFPSRRTRSGSSSFLRLTWLALSCVCLPAVGGVIAGPVYASFPGANGRIAFDTEEEIEERGVNGIATVFPDGGGLEHIAAFNLYAQVEPAWSADGTRLAYVAGFSYPEALHGVGHEIVVANSDGTDPVVVSKGGFNLWPSWTPDGNVVYYRQHYRPEEEGPESGLWESNPNTGESVEIAIGNYFTDPVVSPQGDKVVYGAYSPETGTGIYTSNLDGSDIERLTDEDAEYLEWAPSGRELVYDNPVGVWIVNADGSGKRLVSSAYGPTAWSPDGRKLAVNAYFSGEGDYVYLMNVDGTSVERVGPPTAGGKPAWQALEGGPAEEPEGPPLTAVTLDSSANPAVYGSSATLKATVKPLVGKTVPEGSIVFSEGHLTLATVTLAHGRAVYHLSRLSPGSHEITASYEAEGSEVTGSSSSIKEGIEADTTELILSSSADPSVYGQPVNVRAKLQPVAPGGGAPTGTVTFTDGLLTLATVTLQNSAASYRLPDFSVGEQAITVAYSGDSGFSAGAAQSLTQTIDEASTQISLTASADPAKYGSKAYAKLVVKAVGPGSQTPTGYITVTEGPEEPLAVIPLSAGVAKYSVGALPPGEHALTFAYGGDSNDLASGPVAYTQIISP